MYNNITTTIFVKKILYFAIAAITISCTNRNYTYISDEDFGQTMKLEKILGIDALINDVARMVKIGDEVVVQNFRDSAIFCVYNYKSGEFVRSWGYQGQADNEYIFPDIIKLEDEKFAIYDGGKNKMEYYNNTTTLPSKTIKLEPLNLAVNDMSLIGDNEYVFYFPTPNKTTIYKWEVGKEVIPLPALDVYTERYSDSNSYAGFIATNENGKFVYAFNYIDGFDMFDANGNCIKSIRRKDSNGISSFTGYKDDESEEDFRVFSFRVYADNEGFYIYRVNHSNSELSESLERTTYIEQFDWEGCPIRRYEYQGFIRNFCPLGDGKFIIYDITSENEALQIYEPTKTN